MIVFRNTIILPNKNDAMLHIGRPKWSIYIKNKLQPARFVLLVSTTSFYRGRPRSLAVSCLGQAIPKKSQS